MLSQKNWRCDRCHGERSSSGYLFGDLSLCVSCSRLRLFQCTECSETIFSNSLLCWEGDHFHKTCFRCAYCQNIIKSNFYSQDVPGLFSEELRVCSGCSVKVADEFDVELDPREAPTRLANLCKKVGGSSSEAKRRKASNPKKSHSQSKVRTPRTEGLGGPKRGQSVSHVVDLGSDEESLPRKYRESWRTPKLSILKKEEGSEEDIQDYTPLRQRRTCTICTNELENVKSNSGDLICLNCAKPCRQCGVEISGKSVVIGDDWFFHLECFACSICRKELEVADGVMMIERTNQIACSDCGNRMAHSSRPSGMSPEPQYEAPKSYWSETRRDMNRVRFHSENIGAYTNPRPSSYYSPPAYPNQSRVSLNSSHYAHLSHDPTRRESRQPYRQMAPPPTTTKAYSGGNYGYSEPYYRNTSSRKPRSVLHQ